MANRAKVSIVDLEHYKFFGAARGSGKQTNLLATATLAAPGEGKRMRVVKVDASYSSSSTSGLLQIKSGATVIFEKYIHGAGAHDFSDYGLPAININEAMSAELAAGGAGIVGTVTISGFSHPEPAS